MEEITYSRATLNDLPTLVDLRVIFATTLSAPQSPEAIEEFRKYNIEYLTRAIPNNSFIVFLARHGHEPVGVGGIVFREQIGNFKNPSGRVGYLMNMYTSPQFRRRGICSKILNLLLEEATQMGITAFELHATEEGEFVYKQNGFKIHHEPTYRKYL